MATATGTLSTALGNLGPDVFEVHHPEKGHIGWIRRYTGLLTGPIGDTNIMEFLGTATHWEAFISLPMAKALGGLSYRESRRDSLSSEAAAKQALLKINGPT
ncbi:hypothetical protein GCM10023196_037140 [Actinoallomurus vinaceus]|uniref:Uncharacterized protein n=1 Tax=Actinoallomurus vinaceus TaxID=1080074 RepID=A0ABP8UAS8_9ACTN